MRTLALAILVVALGGYSAAQTSKPTKRTYVKHTYGRRAAVGAVADGAVGHLRHSPKEWHGASGFGKHVASSFGTHVVGNSIHYGVSAARHEEMGYRPSGEHGFGKRMKYALTSTVVTRKTTTGKKTVAAGTMSGAFGSGMVSRAWQPASTRTVGAGLASGGTILGVEAGSHVVREFWPE